MPQIGLGFSARTAVCALGFWLTLVCSTRGDDDSLRRLVLGLNNITGSDVVKEQVRLLQQDPKEARALLKTALALSKEKKAALTYNAAHILAQVAVKLKDLKNGEFFFRICMAKAAELKSSRKLVHSYGGLIDLFFENKKFAESARVCRELLELKTDDGKPRTVVFLVSTRFGDTDFIEDDRFDSAKNLRPGVHRLLIQAIAKQGKYEQALKLVENLIKPQGHWLEFALKGWVLREAGRYADAAKTYEDVLERITKDKKLDSEDRDAYQDTYRYILSNIYVDLNQIEQASEQLQALLAKNPNDPGYNNDLGYIWADRDLKLPEAEKLIRKAIDLDRKRRKAHSKLAPEKDRDNGAYLDSLGWVLFKQKKFQEAKEVLIKAVEDESSQHIEIYDHLGDVHMALGEREAALTVWRKGLELASESRRDQQRRVLVEKKLQMYK